MSYLDQAVGHNLRALRKSKRWTQEETIQRMSEKLGRSISVAGNSRWETKRTRWTTSELLAMCEAFEQGRLESGKIVCTVAFGAGLTWGHALFRW